MERALPLDKMTLAEKLSAMENIWDDLLRNTENLPSPAWHRDVLQARESRIADNTAHYHDWDYGQTGYSPAHRMNIKGL